MRKKIPWAMYLAFIVIGITVSACNDAITNAPPPATVAEALGSSSARFAGQGNGLAYFPCTTSNATPGGAHRYEYGSASVPFPRGELARDGATIRYHYTGYASGAEITRVVHCIIPNTAAALRRMDRLLGVKNGDDTGGALSTLGMATCYGWGCDDKMIDTCEFGGTFPRCNPPPSARIRDCGLGSYCLGGGGGGSQTPEPPAPEQPCATGYAMIDSPEVQAGFDELWRKSGADLPMDQRQEQAGWVIQGTDGTFTFEPAPVSWQGSPCQIDVPQDATIPAGATALVHTHPYRLGETLTSCPKQTIEGLGSFYVSYSGDPSFVDDDTMRTLRGAGLPLIGIVIDNQRITAYTGEDGPSSQVRVERCGY